MGLRIERLDLTNHWLTRSFRVSQSSCENPEYFSEYLRDAALVDWKKGLATTHLLIREQDGDDRIIGYITLRASSYTKDVGGIVLGDPAVEIFELAIADGEEKSGMGAELMKFALLTAAELREIIGVRYVAHFYLKHRPPLPRRRITAGGSSIFHMLSWFKQQQIKVHTRFMSFVCKLK